LAERDLLLYLADHVHSRVRVIDLETGVIEKMEGIWFT